MTAENDIFLKEVCSMKESAKRIPELFGSMVFSESTMQQYMSKGTFSAWKQCITDGTALPLTVANEIAEAMKEWATERGATHFTHWFQPMTGVIAEKHDSFISPIAGGQVIMDFSGKELVRGEPDASSFPSGGLRATFEARGYTAWDPSSFAFLKDGTLYIPTIFCSYSGEALDKKTPLLRSMEAVSRQAVRVLRLFGDTETRRVTAQVGPEQEYFLVDKKLYARREDLRFCGRTLFGAKPPKGQELDDHYFGVIRPRVAAYMQDLDEELWKLGVLSKTKHNEVAPSQHEMAPIYSDANTACDHNQLTMETMQRVADRHDFVCLLHEKPYAGVNGSGKHDNWSLCTDTGKNLFAPGATPSQNAQFLLFLAAFIKGVDEYQELLRCSVASAGNDHRLGANEAPPAVISIFLGDELMAILDSLIAGTSYTDAKKKTLEIGVDTLPHISQDTTDRNRTSPVAFTGNKFEFRMPGSSQSIAGPNIALNTIMAEELRQFADALEAAPDFKPALHDLVVRAFADHSRILFNGNGYDASWLVEARKRGLANLSNSAEAFASYMSDKNVALFTSHGVFTKTEMQARDEIHFESYCKKLHIEAMTMLDMVSHQILPAAVSYSGKLCETILAKRGAVADICCSVEEQQAKRVSELAAALSTAAGKLRSAVDGAPKGPVSELAGYYHDMVFFGMAVVREAADALEAMVPSDCWPYPTYVDLLFSE